MILKNIWEIVSQKKNSLVFLTAGASMFALLSILMLASTADYSIAIFIMMNGVWFTFLSIITSLVISILFGTYFALALHRIKNASLDVKENSAGVFGFAAGIFASGCPMCGSILFGFFGMPLALFLLPFKGLELKAASIVLLAVSIALLAKNPACKIETKKEKN